MNRLVLIGNGFDLAHGLKTSYAYFINWYWCEWGKRLLTGNHDIESDELCSFILKPTEFYSTWYQFWIGPYMKKSNSFAPWNPKDIVRIAKENNRICLLKYTTHFFEQINNNIETKGWVDIEDEYYSMLVREKDYGDRVRTLNKQLDFLREKLVEYLTVASQMKTTKIEGITEKIYCPVGLREIAVEKRKELTLKKGFPVRNIMLLNFNYTSTPERYMEGHSNVTINYIHGRLDNPQSVIFGYGDELDKNYSGLKEQNNNECLRHVKAINYLESDNYRKVLEFIESDQFQICIMGHSCGRSDRTLLNTLFEHPNCVSIKPYYYIDNNGEDHYRELTQNIHRNFTDRKLMRDRVVNKTYTEPL